MKYSTANDAAFPRPCGMANDAECLEQDGMTIREWYAGQAMVGILSNSDLPDLFKKGFAPSKMAEIAFACADAMLTEGRRAHDVQMAIAKRRALEHPDETV